MTVNPNLAAWGDRRRGPRAAGIREWDADPQLEDKANYLEDAERASQASREERARTAADRVHRAGADAMNAAGMRSHVVDPSFGDDARQIRHRLPNGYELSIGGPHSQVGYDSGNTEWHAAIHPPGVDYHVGGEQVHYDELGVFHPRDLPGRVHEYLRRPDVRSAIQRDQENVVGNVERINRNRERGPLLRAYDVHGVQGIMRHLGPQFGGD
jgi:hypothetical protein